MISLCIDNETVYGPKEAEGAIVEELSDAILYVTTQGRLRANPEQVTFFRISADDSRKLNLECPHHILFDANHGYHVHGIPIIVV